MEVGSNIPENMHTVSELKSLQNFGVENSQPSNTRLINLFVRGFEKRSEFSGG